MGKISFDPGRLCFVALIFVLSIQISSSDELLTTLVTSTATPANANLSADSIVKQWENIEKSSKEMAKNGVKTVLRLVLGEGQSKFNMSSKCMAQSLKVLAGIRELKPWAYSFLDASAKMIDGMLGGTLANFGEYDQCLDTEAREERRGKNHGKLLFRGQYCALDITPPLPPKKSYYKLNGVMEELKNFSQRGTAIAEAAKTAHLFYLVAMRIGICIPSGCRESDISQITDSFSELIGVSVKVKRCEIKEDNNYTPTIIGIMCLFCFFGLLLVIGTTIDLFYRFTKRQNKGTVVKVFLCFSFINSFKKLVHVSDEKGPLNCFGGLRFFSITWIILGHTYLNINLMYFQGLKKVMDFPKDFAFQAVINATVSVDTFFFMGGALVCYLSVKLVKEMKKPFNIVLYLFHRLFRIYPVYVMAIGFMFLAPLIGSGPAWHDVIDRFLHSCERNWWENLVFINNFYHSDDMCLPQSWYVSCDIQLYILALLVLLPLFRWPKVGISIATLAVLASMAGSGFLTYYFNHPPTMLYVHPDLDDRISLWSTSYFKPYSHAGPYFLGMLVGYLLITKPNLRLSLPVRIVGWCAATACNLAVLYGVWNWNKGVDATFLETMFYSSCHRVAWTLGVSWVVINCATGQGGVVNYILTWRCWTVLGRLTYAAYLIHPIIQITIMGVIRVKLQPIHWFAVWMFLGHLCVTYACAFAASMLVEAPFLSLEKLMFSSKLKELEDETSDEPVKEISDSDKGSRLSNGTNGALALTSGYFYQGSATLDRTNGYPRNYPAQMDYSRQWRTMERPQPNGRVQVGNGNSPLGQNFLKMKTIEDGIQIYRL